MGKRGLKKPFLTRLQTGFLSGITEKVRADKSLDLQIRENYLNIYFRGNALLKLVERRGGKYRVEIHEKFVGDRPIDDLVDEETTEVFLSRIPYLKERIIQHGGSSLETEYEQLIIRANNWERRNNSEYFIIDRQYAVNRLRFDLTGFFWDSKKPNKGDIVPLCLMEIKFGLNQDIQTLHEQLRDYYNAMKSRFPAIAEEAEILFKQKLKLGLIDQSKGRLVAMETLEISKCIGDCQFLIVLVDYNPKSELFKRTVSELESLEFSDQIRVFTGGFAMWRQNLRLPKDVV